MEFDDRLDEFKTIFRRSALPDTVRQSYEQILAFVDGGERSGDFANFSGELASILGCKLDLFFPVPETEEEVEEPEELLSEQRYSDVQEMLRNYKQLEGDVTDAILENVPEGGDETLCVLPAPFRLTPDEDPDPGILGDVITTLLGTFDLPTFLVRESPHSPPDLFDHIVVVGSTLHNIIRLIRCTAGVCPEDSLIHVIAVADRRFVKSMLELLEETKELESQKTGRRLRQTLVAELRRKLRHLDEKLQEEHGIQLEHEIIEDSVDEALEESTLLRRSPSLLSVPLHYSGGGYDTALLEPLFQKYTATEILTI